MGKIVDISQATLDLFNLDSDTLTNNDRAIMERAITGAEGAIARHLGYDPLQRSRTEIYPNRDYMPQLQRYELWELNEAKTHAVLASQTRNRLVSTDLQVRHIPIRSIENLWVNVDGKSISSRFTNDHLKEEANASNSGDFWPNYEARDDAGNQACLDGVIKSYGLWPLEPGTIQIEYTAGYLLDELHGQSDNLNARPIVDAILTETVRRAKKIYLTRKQVGIGWTPGSVVSEKLGDYSYTIGGAGGAAQDAAYGGSADLLPETIHQLADFVNWGWRLAS